MPQIRCPPKWGRPRQMTILRTAAEGNTSCKDRFCSSRLHAGAGVQLRLGVKMTARRLGPALLQASALVVTAPLLAGCLGQVCTPDGKECVVGVVFRSYPCPQGGWVLADSREEALQECRERNQMPKLGQGVDVALTSTGAPIVVRSAPARFTLTAASGAGAILETRDFNVTRFGTVMRYTDPAAVDTWLDSYIANDPDVSVAVSASDVVFDAPGSFYNELVTITGTVSSNGVPMEVASQSYVYQPWSDPEPPEIMR